MAGFAAILEPVRRKNTSWSSVSRALGEYQDFSKFDYEKAGAEISSASGAGVSASRPSSSSSSGAPSALSFSLSSTPSSSSLPRGVVLCPLSQLPPAEQANARAKLFSSPIASDSDRPLAWHAAHMQDGFYLRVPAGIACPPITLLTHANTHSALHHLFIIEKGASAEIILEMVGENSNIPKSSPSSIVPKSSPAHLHTDVSEAFLSEESRLTLTTLQRYGDADWSFNQHYHHLDKFSKLFHTTLSAGSAVSRSRAQNHLSGAHSRVESYQMFFGSARQFMDLESASHHHVPDTEGVMSCKGALDGSAVAVYRGTIRIDRPAANTISHQSGQVLLLSDDCKANIIPSLTVDNDQVEAGHGASVGALDEKEMLYLRARGLSIRDARRLALDGFFAQLTNQLPSKSGRERLTTLTRVFLDQLDSSLSASHAGGTSSSTPPRVISIPGDEARPSAHI